MHTKRVGGVAVALSLVAAAGLAAVIGVSSAASPSAPTVATVVKADQSSPSSTLSSGPVSTSGPQLMVAYLASDSAGPGATFSSVSGCGLSWKRVAAANAQAGPVEVWAASAASPLGGCTVSAQRSFGAWDGSITVVGYAGAAGIGARSTASAPSGAPTVAVTTTAANSLVAGVGNDWDTAVAHVPVAGQSLLSQFLAPVGDTYFVQARIAPVASPSVVTLAQTAPTADRYNLVAVEILPSATTTTAAAVTTTPSTPTTRTRTGSTSTTTSTTTTTTGTTTTAAATPAPAGTTAPTTTTPPVQPASVAAVPSSFPSGSSTGVPAGTALTAVSGDYTVSTAGAVVSGLDISGSLTVTAANVTVKNTRVRCSGVSSFCVSLEGTNTVFTDGEIGGGANGTTFNNSAIGVWMGGSGGTATDHQVLRTNIHHVMQGPRMDGDSTLADSYVHDMSTASGVHSESIY
ncbi:MAG TPA: hypothetical protein VIM19_02785, partial [Actinomycetes bacterium]